LVKVAILDHTFTEQVLHGPKLLGTVYEHLGLPANSHGKDRCRQDKSVCGENLVVKKFRIIVNYAFTGVITTTASTAGLIIILRQKKKFGLASCCIGVFQGMPG
jgi:hypothetical protein